MIEFLWLATVIGGPILIGLAFIWALARRRRLTAGEKRRRHEAVDNLYSERE